MHLPFRSALLKASTVTPSWLSSSKSSCLLEAMRYWLRDRLGVNIRIFIYHFLQYFAYAVQNSHLVKLMQQLHIIHVTLQFMKYVKMCNLL